MKVWVDCTAAAHPLVLKPIIDRLEARGDEVFVTARAYGQTEGILERLGIPYTAVGEHGGASAPGKAWALAGRSARLSRVIWRQRPDLAIAHGSVDLAVVCALFKIPSAQMQDYEFAGIQRRISFRIARRVLVPDSIPVDRLRADRDQGAQAGPLPRPQGGVLPGGTSSPTRASSTSSGSTARRSWSSSARRPRPPSITPATTSTARRSAGSPARPARRR